MIINRQKKAVCFCGLVASALVCGACLYNDNLHCDPNYTISMGGGDHTYCYNTNPTYSWTELRMGAGTGGSGFDSWGTHDRICTYHCDMYLGGVLWPPGSYDMSQTSNVIYAKGSACGSTTGTGI